MKKASVRIPSSKTNLLSSKTDNDILLISYVPILCFFALSSSYFRSDYVFIEQSVFEFINSVVILTLFAVLDSLPSIFFMECSFDFNPTNSSIIFPSDLSFILPITFLLVGSKIFGSFG